MTRVRIVHAPEPKPLETVIAGPPCKWVHGCPDRSKCRGAPKCLGLDPIDRVKP